MTTATEIMKIAEANGLVSREFERPSLGAGWRCPVCLTAHVAPVRLVGKPGTERGGNVEAWQIHTICTPALLMMLAAGQSPAEALRAPQEPAR